MTPGSSSGATPGPKHVSVDDAKKAPIAARSRPTTAQMHSAIVVEEGSNEILVGESLPLLPKTHKEGTRIQGLDIMRGFILALMAIDHISAGIAHVHGSEMWYGETHYDSTPTGILHFLTRFATHMCAPGFSWLMGIGIVCLARSRIDRGGWSAYQVSRYAVTRSVLLIFPCMIPLEYGAWHWLTLFRPQLAKPGREDVWISLSVLYSLSTSMLICGGILVPLLERTRGILKWRGIPLFNILALGVFSLLNFIVSDIVIKKMDPTKGEVNDPHHWALHLFLVPGSVGVIACSYPVIPWVGVCAAGCAVGYILTSQYDSNETNKYGNPPATATTTVSLRSLLLTQGCLFLTAFSILRSLRGFGNLIPIPEEGARFLDFIDPVKYPPSLCFTLLSLGLFSLFGALFETLSNCDYIWRVRCFFNKASESDPPAPYSSCVWRPFKAFGTCPLFYYCTHMWLISFVAAALPTDGVPFGYVFVIWGCLLVVLFPMCERYSRFKHGKSADSWWRFF